MATQFIIACHPAMWHLITPFVEHLQALLVPCLRPNFLWHMALMASLLVPCPVFGQGQAEVEQGASITVSATFGHSG